MDLIARAALYRVQLPLSHRGIFWRFQMKQSLNKFAALALMAPFAVSSAFAQATDGASAGMDAVDLTGLATKVIAAGVLIVGIALAFKGPDLGKRVVRKV